MIWFTSIQKTGSTSLRDLFYKIEPHIGKAKVLNHGYFYEPWECQEDKNKYWLDFGWSDPVANKKVTPTDTIFAVVRNPFDIFASYYLHHKVDGWAKVKVVHNINSFDEFVDKYIDPDFKWHLPPMKRSMFSFAKDQNDQFLVDGFFKLEEADKLSNFVQSLGYSGLPFKNKTPHKTDHYSKYYKPDQVDQLTKIWAKDLEKFNYTYEN